MSSLRGIPKQSRIMSDKLWIATSEYRLAMTENEGFVIQRKLSKEVR